MKWNKIISFNTLMREQLPIDRPFLSLWKGRISLTQYDNDEGRFYIMFDPAQYPGPWKIEQDREYKFTHWMDLPDLPEDY